MATENLELISDLPVAMVNMCGGAGADVAGMVADAGSGGGSGLEAEVVADKGGGCVVLCVPTSEPKIGRHQINDV